MTPYTYGALMNIAYTARQVEISRRRENLPFSHHAEVACLKPEQQEVVLAKAEAEEMSRQEVRAEVARVKRKQAPAGLAVRVLPARRNRLRRHPPPARSPGRQRRFDAGAASSSPSWRCRRGRRP